MIEFGKCWLNNGFFTYRRWAGNIQELSRIYLEVVSDLKSIPKSQFCVSKLDLSTCESGNSEEPTILRTRESGNTEGPTILRTCESGNSSKWTILRTCQSTLHCIGLVRVSAFNYVTQGDHESLKQLVFRSKARNRISLSDYMGSHSAAHNPWQRQEKSIQRDR